MKTVQKMLWVILLVGTCCFVLQCTALCAAVGVRISDLKNTPTPPNPIKVWGKVISVSPVKISDGRSEIEVACIQAKIDDFLVVMGDWNGTVLTTNGQATLYDAVSKVEMIWIPAGSFLMGNLGVGDDATYASSCPDELPQHSVYLSGYYIGKYEVTRGEYRKFMNAGGYSNSAYWSAAGWNWKVSKSRTQPYFWDAVQNWEMGVFTQTDNYPVAGISYYEAEAFCNWTGGHLPTEAQWEKAARWNPLANHPNVYPWGDTWDVDKCNNFFDDNSAGGGYARYQTAPVGSYSSYSSPYGCQDMAGNLYEWCKDWYGNNYYSHTGGWNNPQGPDSGNSRALRGGNCFATSIIRCGQRNCSYPAFFYDGFGFRAAR